MFLIFAQFSQFLGTAYSVLIRQKLSRSDVKYVANNQLYKNIIKTHVIFMEVSVMIGKFGVKSLFFKKFAGNRLWFKFSRYSFTYCKKLIYKSAILRGFIFCIMCGVRYYDLLDLEMFNLFVFVLFISFCIYKALNRSKTISLSKFLVKLVITLTFLKIFWFLCSTLLGLFLLPEGMFLWVESVEGDSNSDGQSISDSDSGGEGGSGNGGQGGGGGSNGGGEFGYAASHSSGEGDDSSTDSGGVPDLLDGVDQTIASCTHESFIPFPDLSQDAVENQTCDLNPTLLANGEWERHGAFVGGLSPVLCPSCQGVFCRDCCSPDNYDSDASLGSTPNNNDDSDQ